MQIREKVHLNAYALKWNDELKKGKKGKELNLSV